MNEPTPNEATRLTDQVFLITMLGVLAFAGLAAELALAGCGEVLRRVELGNGCLARFDLLGETDLVVLGEQRVLTDVGQIQPDEIFLVAFHAVFRHGVSSIP